MRTAHRFAVVVLTIPALLAGQSSGNRAAAAPRVGPAKGTVMVVGGGGMGPDVYARFIAAAGGPDAIILDVPNAGGADTYAPDGPSTRGWKQAGAKNVFVLFTKDRKLADTDSFVAIIKKAGGVWFEGGRQFHLVDDYGGTKTETEFMNVLARGGVVGGSSAGASILGDFLVRGAPSNNNFIMDDPSHQRGFAYLRGVGIDQHVVARERLPDLADSIMPKYPQLLGISEDEGTVWVVRGDTAEIIGRNKAFVYGGKDATDAGKPFLTLHPGDTYDLGARHVMRRAGDGSPVTAAFVGSLFDKYKNPSAGGATVVVAQDGKVLVNESYGIPPQAKYMPTTTVPQFPVGGITAVFESICSQVPEPAPGRGRGAAAPDTTGGAAPPAAAGRGRGGAPAPPMTPFQRCVAQRLSTPVGMHKTTATEAGQVMSNVDELYRLALGLENPRSYSRTAGGDPNAAREPIDYAQGWEADSYRGATRFSAFGAAGGKRNAFVRIPDKHVAIIVLTNDDAADAKGIAGKIADKLLGSR